MKSIILMCLIILSGCSSSCYIPDGESLFINSFKEVNCKEAYSLCIDEAKKHYDRYYESENVTIHEYYKHICSPKALKGKI